MRHKGVWVITLTVAAMPAYNESHIIAEIILGCRKYVDEVIVVDDGSSDNTAEIAKSMGAYVVKHIKNLGYGAALKSCFDTARKLDADEMILIDSDGQHNPEEIPKLLAPLKQGFDLVIGSRFVNGNGKNVPAYRKLGMKVLDIATYVVSGINVTDSQSGFRAYGRKAIEKIKLNSNDMSAGSEILLQIKDHELKFTEVEICCRYDVLNTSSQHPLIHGPKVLLKIFRDMELRRPLYYFTVPGIFLGATGVLMGIAFLQDFYAGGSLKFGPALLMLLLILVGTFMVFTGIILNSISKLLNQIKLIE